MLWHSECQPPLCGYFYFVCLFSYRIIQYKSLFPTSHSLSRCTAVPYHSHTSCQIKPDNFLLLEYLAHESVSRLSIILAAVEQSSTLRALKNRR